MNKELKGMCLFLGVIGLGYAALLLSIMLFTGVKIFKSVVFIFTFSSFLVSLGLTAQVKQRIVQLVKSKISGSRI
ncbi:hypothetical protein L0668_04410 [Paraglaciecola aquimarina]|uniref:Uncharacterized protein n=1 Tax=Paraglaciecola algarum TaxID=3050085 RepID=A0ABS9D345_9ALTE|nr:hypothetical protein [Paraglaciecola sp. G1-23]MCF2947339.1 hypothetical protein [Paraglaciecola sp. G1-23]